MNCIDILSILLLFGLEKICCHGDTAEKSKLLLIAMEVNLDKSILIDIPLRFDHILLHLNHTSRSRNENFDSIINGCYPKNAPICEPIWVTNQRHKYESALLDWPNQLVFNNTWPTFSFGCPLKQFSLHQRLERMLDWLSRPLTSLGIMSIHEGSNSFLVNISKAANHHNLNIILLSFNSNNRNRDESEFLAFGPNIRNVNESVRWINMVDISGVIGRILKLSGATDAYRDGNATLASLLTKTSDGHGILSVYNWIIIGAVVGIAVVLGCIIFVEAVKTRNSKIPKMNHQYNLGLTTTSNINGFLENEYLLNGSDEEELFADSLPQIQTSRQH